MAVNTGYGLDINIEKLQSQLSVNNGCYLIEIQETNMEPVSKYLGKNSIPFYQIAKVLEKKTLLINSIEYDINNIENNWRNAIEQYMVT